MRPLFNEVLDVIRTSSAAREATVRQLRGSTRDALVRHRAMRRGIARALRQTLRRRRAALLNTLRASLAGYASASVPLTSPQASEAAAPAPRVARDEHVWDLAAQYAPQREVDATCELLQAQVLQVIENHPEGVHALEIGNHLGVDWRWVVGLSKNLLDAGAVEQIGHRLYPAAKAGRTW